jgi:hypothetical protein
MRNIHPPGQECARSQPLWRAVLFLGGLSLGCGSKVGDESPTGGSGATPGTGGTPATGGSAGAGGVGGTGGSSAAGGMQTGGSSGTGVGGSGVAGSGGSSGAGTGGTLGACESVAPPAQRIVRLSFAQVENTYTALLGPEARTALEAAAVLSSGRHREFAALFDEGELLNTDLLHRTRTRAEAAANTVGARLAATTGCAAATDTACITTYLNTLAERTFRRPITPEERASIEMARTEIAASGVTPEDAVEFAIQAILLSPSALYRTEIGTVAPGATVATLTNHELASLISYFLLNGPPDPALAAAATAGTLATPEGVRTEVDRLIATPEVQANLTEAMLAYYDIGDLDSTAKDDALFPEWTLGVSDAAYRETELFLGRTLWQGTVRDLVLSRHTFVDQNLATFYGIPYPGGSGFVEVDLPEGQRAGLLSQISMMAIRSRPDTTSVVSRGLFINNAVLCAERPEEPPADLQAEVDALKNDPTLNEREKAEFRAGQPRCAGCHIGFDQYGLVLESYDAIGRYRSTYPDQKPIDTSVTLPETLGSLPAANYVEFANLVANSGLFSNCLTTKLVQFATAWGEAEAYHCSVRTVHDAFNAGDGTFKSLVREVAASAIAKERTVSP